MMKKIVMHKWWKRNKERLDLKCVKVGGGDELKRRQEIV